MTAFLDQSPLAFALGIVGNVVSLAVFLAPAPTFYRIWRKKSTEGFQSLPYITVLLSASLWIYYASRKSATDFLLITTNSLGCLIESIYLLIYVIFAPTQVRVVTLRLLMLLNVGGVCFIIMLSNFVLPKGSTCIQFLGGICVVSSVCVFAAPLYAMRTVLRTKSVEFMPLPLSFSLTVNALIWFLYGIILKDIFVAIPNSMGIILGVVQMALYVHFRKWDPPRVATEIDTMKLPTTSLQLQFAAPVPEPDNKDEPPKPQLANPSDDCKNIGSTDDDPVIITVETSPAAEAPPQAVIVDENLHGGGRKEYHEKYGEGSRQGLQQVVVVGY